VESAALLAVTTQEPAEEGAVKVLPDTVQLPDVTLYVTAPVPVPPVVLNAEVPPVVSVEGLATAVMVCAAMVVVESLPPPQADTSNADATAKTGSLK
jgi:hypothetical protein